MGIDKARFRKQVVPGDSLTLETEMLQRRGSVVKVSAKAMVGDAVAAEAVILATLIDRDDLN